MVDEKMNRSLQAVLSRAFAAPALHSITPRARSASRCSWLRPAEASTASVCSPSVGARSRTTPGLSDRWGNTAGMSTAMPLAARTVVMASRAR